LPPRSSSEPLLAMNSPVKVVALLPRTSIEPMRA
jgi:hypothetical protein